MLGLQSLDGIAPLQDALADMFPYLTQQVLLMIGLAGPAVPKSAQSVVHEFTDDEGWTLAVTLGSATVSVGGQYAGVGDSAGRFRKVCTTPHGAGWVRRRDRLGVRYLDLVELEDGTEDWAPWFRPEIVGLARTDPSSVGLIASITETHLSRHR